MKSKALNKKQGIGLFCVGVAVLIITLANKILEGYEEKMTGVAMILFVTGLFLILKYRK